MAALEDIGIEFAGYRISCPEKEALLKAYLNTLKNSFQIQVVLVQEASNVFVRNTELKRYPFR